MIGTVTRDELKAKIERRDDFILIETLQPPAYMQTHLPGAINLPPDRIKELAPELLPDRSAEIVVYCSGPT